MVKNAEVFAGQGIPEHKVCSQWGPTGVACSALSVRPLLQHAQPGRERA